MEHLTRWSQVTQAGGDGPHARAALDWLVRTYAPVLQARIRQSFPDEVDDVLQEFWLSLWERRGLATVDAHRGRFRSWLLTCLDHHVADHAAAATAAKRGGGQRPIGAIDELQVAADASPVSPFRADVAWAARVVERAHERLREQTPPEGQERLQLLAPFLTTVGTAEAYGEVGRVLGLGEGAVKVAVHRLRKALGQALRQEVADTLVDPTPAAIDAEVADLLDLLRTSSHA